MLTYVKLAKVLKAEHEEQNFKFLPDLSSRIKTYWDKLLDEYFLRILTYSDDVLPAFFGTEVFQCGEWG